MKRFIKKSLHRKDQIIKTLHAKKEKIINSLFDDRNVFDILPLIMLFGYILLFSIFYLIFLRNGSVDHSAKCEDPCKIKLVESIPENLTFPEGSPLFGSTYHAWKSLLNNAEKSVDLAVFYWALKNEDVTPIKMPSSWQGEDILKEIYDIGKKKNVAVRIAQNAPTERQPQNDSKYLEQEGAAKVRSVDFNQLIGAGVLHTKMWIVDDEHIYLGSANMDWQSLTQVKEVGVLIENCSCLAKDLSKVFQVYWILGKRRKVPREWPSYLDTEYNKGNPMILSNPNVEAFISSSPFVLNPDRRTNDIDAIVYIMRAAERFIHIAVMDYFPRMLYCDRNMFWPAIDDEIRRAALDRKVHVRLLASHWNHTEDDMIRWLRSLQDISGQGYPLITIEVKLFTVPAYTDDQKKLKYARVNHNKYMVTDKTAYVGTSNWSGDYFENTAGVSISISEKKNGDMNNTSHFRQELESLFQRDWNSPFAKSISSFGRKKLRRN